MILDDDKKTFVMHVAIQKQEKMLMHSKRETKVKALLFDKAFLEVLAEYSDYSNVFSTENIVELPENIGMKKYTIKLEENKQPSFEPIYRLG